MVKINDNLKMAEKNVVSIRDGVQFYYGFEIDKLPANKQFSVYRSPQTLDDIAGKMAGIPVNIEHIEGDNHGRVLDSQIEQEIIPETNTTKIVKNKVEIDDTVLNQIDQGLKELSLGYDCDLIPHKLYDFEQINIIPDHLAFTVKGRCDEACRVLDKAPACECGCGGACNVIAINDNKQHKEGYDTMSLFKKRVHDADTSNQSMSDVSSMIASAKDDLADMPIDDVQEVLALIQQKKQKQDQGDDQSSGEEQESNSSAGDISATQNNTQNMAQSTSPASDGTKASVGDSAPKELQVSQKMLDSMVHDRVMEHISAIEKGRRFLGDSYDFAKATPQTIMRDSVERVMGVKVADHEIETLFNRLDIFSSQKEEMSKGYDNFINMNDSATDGRWVNRG